MTITLTAGTEVETPDNGTGVIVDAPFINWDGTESVRVTFPAYRMTYTYQVADLDDPIR